jgi:glucose/arabinose dehydrogenase
MCYESKLLLSCIGLLLCLSNLTAHGAEFSWHYQTLSVDGENWRLRIPSETQLELLTTDLDGPRLMTFLPNGDLIVGSRSGNVYLLKPPYTTPHVLINLPGYPHSVAYRDGMLFIARTDGLYRAPYRSGQETLARDELERVAALPAGGGHNSRSVAVGPDKRLYVSLGITGNCSDEYLGKGYAFEDRRGGVLVLDESGNKPMLKPYASGLRNPVGFDWHPVTGELYASNNGPDHLGFEQPPEYFSRLSAGSFHGMPWYQFNGQGIQRDNCIQGKPPRPLNEVVMPVATFPARNAPMGVAFIPEDSLDKRFENNAIVAFKGSWGTQPHGGHRGDPATRRPPRIMMVPFRDGKAMNAIDIVSGFQRPNGERLARPVGVAVGPDGALYFTSDSETAGLFRLVSVTAEQSTPKQP